MEHRAKIVLAEDVYKKINWFTQNFDKEIGGIGKVKTKKNEDGEKYFYV